MVTPPRRREEHPPERFDELLARWTGRSAGPGCVVREVAGRLCGRDGSPATVAGSVPVLAPEGDYEAERRRQLAALAAWDPGAPRCPAALP
jgi:hypothetical protein